VAEKVLKSLARGLGEANRSPNPKVRALASELRKELVRARNAPPLDPAEMDDNRRRDQTKAWLDWWADSQGKFRLLGESLIPE
jgi:hypothetical protein